jgi:hypothetical protein
LAEPGALNRENRGLRGYQGFFLALTLVVMIIVILIAPNLTTAVIVIGLITNLFIISSQVTLHAVRHLVAQRQGSAHVRMTRGLGGIDEALGASVMVNPGPGVLAASPMGGLALGGAEAFTTATTAPPGAGAPAFPYVPTTSPVKPGTPERYPGAIDFGQTGQAVVGDEAPALGHVDWDAAARDEVPEGNPFDPGRIASPQAAAPCVDDDALLMYDGDELNVLQVRSRNNPERVWAGIYRRKALVARYVEEELDQAENQRWWGNSEV